MHSIYPWQKQEWQQFLSRKNNGQLPHAILIKGMEGLGKYHFAECIANELHCNSLTNLIVIRPEEKSKNIKIDQIREVVAELGNTSQQGGYRIVIIEYAELLNNAASNSLLKTLEEPAENVIIILISSHPTALAATIRSRCQIISIKIPSSFEAEEWLRQNIPNSSTDLIKPAIKLALALAENAPLKALNILQEDNLSKRQEFFKYLYDLQNKKLSIVCAAEKYLDWDLNSLLMEFMLVVSDIIKIKFFADESIVNQDQIKELTQLSVKININTLLEYQTQLFKLRQDIVKNINFNQQLTVENLIIWWS